MGISCRESWAVPGDWAFIEKWETVSVPRWRERTPARLARKRNSHATTRSLGRVPGCRHRHRRDALVRVSPRPLGGGVNPRGLRPSWRSASFQSVFATHGLSRLDAVRPAANVAARSTAGDFPVARAAGDDLAPAVAGRCADCAPPGRAAAKRCFAGRGACARATGHPPRRPGGRCAGPGIAGSSAGVVGG